MSKSAVELFDEAYRKVSESWPTKEKHAMSFWSGAYGYEEQGRIQSEAAHYNNTRSKQIIEATIELLRSDIMAEDLKVLKDRMSKMELALQSICEKLGIEWEVENVE